nr:immunoglobulin heavy chain junction region [Mus musculus]MBK4189515.1 immunoglobulin heavy chain junction region [Mus musculus]MBK4189516.1 immunoglobulin heavy chain junction region [Mus musculus]MBK4189517.1 immunoglobulin heavy chain junction region [Mus musculus]MBK4189518.1 immunoglobulin heavy chain junction region [Mus musculus]
CARPSYGSSLAYW